MWKKECPGVVIIVSKGSDRERVVEIYDTGIHFPIFYREIAHEIAILNDDT